MVSENITDPQDITEQDIPLDKQTPQIEVARNIGPPGKLRGYDFYRTMLKSSKRIVAPMVDQSELAWRLLSRRYAAELCYTPMIHSKVFLDAFKQPSSRQHVYCQQFLINAPGDRPLIAQFCGNNCQTVLEAALIIAGLGACDAVDLNLGCPQSIAKRGFYGAYLMDDWSLVASLISTLDRQCSVPVTAKIRVFDSEEKTIAYAKMVVEAGAQVLTVHGRTRDMKGSKTGIADWEIIRKIKEAVSVPVFANGNVLYNEDAERCLQVTGCDGIMTAEGNLYNPAIFSPALAKQDDRSSRYRKYSSNPDFLDLILNQTDKYPFLLEHPPTHIVALEFLDICLDLIENRSIPERSISISATRGHLFKMMNAVHWFYPESRPSLYKSRTIKELYMHLLELGKVIERDIMMQIASESEERWSMKWLTNDGLNLKGSTVEGVAVWGGKFRVLPFWVLQPYIRAPVPVADSSKQTTPVTVTDEHEHVEQELLLEEEEAVFQNDELENSLQMGIAQGRQEASETRKVKRKADKANKAEIVKRLLSRTSEFKKCATCLKSSASEKCPYDQCKKCCVVKFCHQVRNLGANDEENAFLECLKSAVSKHAPKVAEILCDHHCSASWLKIVNKLG